MNKKSIVLEYERAKEQFGKKNAVSHMLRTPVTCILGFSSLLSTTTITPDQKKHIKNITQAAYQLLIATEFLVKEIGSNKQHQREVK